MSQALLHIISTADLAAARAAGEIVAPSLGEEGFIHCSMVDQVLHPANERFAGRTDLVLVLVDPSLIEAEVVVEDSYGSGMAFPHVYGPIPVAAITFIVDFPPNPDRTFSLPPGISS